MRQEPFENPRNFTEELIDIVVRGEKAAHQGKDMKRSLSEITQKAQDFVNLNEVVLYFILQQEKKINELVSMQNKPKEDPEQKASIFDFEKNSGIDPLEAFICVKALVEEQLRMEMGVGEYERAKNNLSLRIRK
jgi:hypothetical protein